MAEPFKNLLGPEAIRRASGHLERAVAGFDGRAFERHALKGLDRLEFKARAQHIADALERQLPADFPKAARAVRGALAEVRGDEAISEVSAHPSGLCGWILWPMGVWVERRGLDHPDAALDLLRELTQRFTAEWALRPFLEHHRERTFAQLESWLSDPSHHVRRLVSEGSRPRLPWGRQLRFLIEDPTPTLGLLERLLDDTSAYVRRSVANHLGDIGKDHPAVLAEFVERHLPGATGDRVALLRHACRVPIKAGDRRILAAFGLAADFQGEALLRLSAKRVALGNHIGLDVELRSTARRPQVLEIDYAVWHQGANGLRPPKVFKGWRKTIPPGERLQLEKRHPLVVITTRRYYPGEHRIELRINGRAVAQQTFRLSLPHEG